MASNWSLCGVCDHLHITNPSEVWCSECGEGLCGDCKEHHGVSKGTKHHETVFIIDYKKLPTEILQIAQMCDKHNSKYEFFCKKHDCVCCKCCLKYHKSCKVETDINKVIKNVKTSNAFHEIVQSLLEVVVNIKHISSNREDNLTLLVNKKKEIEEEIQQTRTNINNHLDKLQNDLMKELMVTEQKESSKVRKLLTTLKQREQKMAKYHMFDVAIIGNDSIAVTSAESDNINIIDIKKRKLKKPMKVNSGNYGVVYKEGNLICCSRKKGLKMISLRDESIINVLNIELPPNAYVTTFADKLIYTKGNNNSVTCCDYHGQILWTFCDTSVLIYPLGASVDNGGNVFVVGYASHNVVVISADGQRCRQLVSRRTAGLIDPTVLHYDQRTNTLLVATSKGDAFLYHVT
ncbi:uncharacterized protein LOC134686008 [Mytilus trossulus]|uniref:uncharacterized protein LOC134686008 n=1 Tax=Mytilus trossulus TaxID=6551 RepID=UPI003006B381